METEKRRDSTTEAETAKDVPESSCETLISSLRVLASDIESQDGAANAAIAEASDRMERMHKALVEIRDSKYLSYDSGSGGEYSIGVTDGHRFCARIARDAIGDE